MRKCANWPIGVCTWSLRNDLEALDGLMKSLDIGHVHLDLRPVCIDGSAEYLPRIKKRGWIVSSTMIGFPQEDYATLETIRQTGGIVPDKDWPQNSRLFTRAVEITRSLNVPYLSLHIGFIDHSRPEEYQKMLDRVRWLADKAWEAKVTMLMETGQESAEDLKSFLLDLAHPAAAINFDPANMILYEKGNPQLALKTLAPWIRHVHVKDAVFTHETGRWGTEVPWAAGQVGAELFLEKLKEINYEGALAIEREAGSSRLSDIEAAVRRLVQFQG